MRIEVLFRSHRFEEFDTSALTCPEPYRAVGANVLTDWNLCLGDLEHDGIVLVQHWYDGTPGGLPSSVTIDGVEVPAAQRKVGCAILLVDSSELGEVIWLKKDGEKLLWRQGDDLINGERFFAMEQLCYSDAATQSVNRRAVAVFDYLRNASPELSDDDIAESMGFTTAALNRIRDAELAQEDVFGDEDEEGEILL